MSPLQSLLSYRIFPSTPRTLIRTPFMDSYIPQMPAHRTSCVVRMASLIQSFLVAPLPAREHSPRWFFIGQMI